MEGASPWVAVDGVTTPQGSCHPLWWSLLHAFLLPLSAPGGLCCAEGRLGAHLIHDPFLPWCTYSTREISCVPALGPAHTHTWGRCHYRIHFELSRLKYREQKWSESGISPGWFVCSIQALGLDPSVSTIPVAWHRGFGRHRPVRDSIALYQQHLRVRSFSATLRALVDFLFLFR